LLLLFLYAALFLNHTVCVCVSVCLYWWWGTCRWRRGSHVF